MTKKRKLLPPASPGKDYEIGYGRPPTHAQFKPGQSGNPKGRPKGAKTRKSGRKDEQFKEILLEEAYREVLVQDGQRSLSMPVAQAAVRSLSIRAAKGEIRAAKIFLDLIQRVEASRRQDRERWLKTVIEYKVDWERELELRAAQGTTHLPDPLPHPDDIIIDFVNDTVSIVGPMTKEEKALYDRALELRNGAEEDLRHALEELKTATDPDVGNMLEEDIARDRRLLAVLGKKIKPG